MRYRCEATSVAGLIQQLAVGYVARGYRFYVVGRVPKGKDPAAVDRKLLQKYGIEISKSTRARRKALGFASVQYIRFRETFVLIATAGKHEFFLEEAAQIRDVREAPIKLYGYAITERGGHPHVRIEQRQYLELKSYLADIAVHRSREFLERALGTLPFEPYAPIRVQLHCVLREINRRRKLAGFALLPSSCIRVRRRIVRPFASDLEYSERQAGAPSKNDFGMLQRPGGPLVT